MRQEMEKYLHITLDEIKRSNGHVSETTAKNPSRGTCRVISWGEHRNLPRLARSRNHEILGCSSIRRSQRQGRIPVRQSVHVKELLRRRRCVEEARNERLTRAFEGHWSWVKIRWLNNSRRWAEFRQEMEGSMRVKKGGKRRPWTARKSGSRVRHWSKMSASSQDGSSAALTFRGCSWHLCPPVFVQITTVDSRLPFYTL